MQDSGRALQTAFSGGFSPEGSRRYFAQFKESHPHYSDELWFRTLPGLNWRVSQLGFGGYRVRRKVREHVDALRDALLSGVNVIDTAGNYDDGGSESLIGQTLEELFRARRLSRDMVAVISKGGYLQGESARLLMRGRDDLLHLRELGPDRWHSLDARFLEDQATLSLSRLGLSRLDVFLLHNPETALIAGPGAIDRKRFDALLGEAFGVLEAMATSGRIGCYGISSNAFCLPPDRAEALSLPDILRIAGPGFRVIQFPANLLESDFRFSRAAGYSLSETAESHGLWTLSNRPLNANHSQAGLLRLARLVEAPPDDGFGAMASFDAGIGRLREIEGEIENLFGGRFAFNERLPAPSEVIRLLRPTLLHREALRANLPAIVARVQLAVNRLAACRENDTERLAIEALLRLTNAALAQWERELDARYHQRLQSVEEALAASAPALAGRPLAQQALLFLLCRPTPHTVLVGMRQKAYVRQLIEVFGLPRPAPEQALGILQASERSVEAALADAAAPG